MTAVASENLLKWRKAVTDAVRPMHNTPPWFKDDPEIGSIGNQPITQNAVIAAVLDAKDARSGVGLKLPEEHGFAVIPEDFINFLQFRADEMAAQGALKYGPRLSLFEAALAVRDRNDARLEERYPGYLQEVAEKRDAKKTARELALQDMGL
jgi:hypothetical protein